jgi:hypothetical protein
MNALEHLASLFIALVAIAIAGLVLPWPVTVVLILDDQRQTGQVCRCGSRLFHPFGRKPE